MRNIKVTLDFSEEEVQEFLNAANFGEEGALQLQDLSDERFEELKKEIVDTADNFKEEILEGSREACANDWLIGFGNE